MAKGREPLTIKQELEWAVPFLNTQLTRLKSSAPISGGCQRAVKLSMDSTNNKVNFRLEAEVLMAKVLKWERVKVLTHLFDPISEISSQHFRKKKKKRATGYPLQHLLGSQEFMSLDFLVTPDVLIPRDDTEILVETVLKLKTKVKLNPAVVDIGTGSGIIAVTLKKYWPHVKLYAVDISPQALAVAQANARRHQVEIEFCQGDLLTPFKDKQTFEIIVANPPYIASKALESLQVEVTKEPSLALDGGVDGLDFYRRLAQSAPDYLTKNGWLAVEIGADQGSDVKAIFRQNGFAQVEIVKDYAGLDRVVYGVKSKVREV